jgi:hypothetical protein
MERLEKNYEFQIMNYEVTAACAEFRNKTRAYHLLLSCLNQNS